MMSGTKSCMCSAEAKTDVPGSYQKASRWVITPIYPIESIQ